MKSPIPRIALTPGEPAGIGPDLCAKIAQQSYAAELVVITDPEIMASRAKQLGLPLELETLSLASAPTPHKPGRLKVIPIAVPGQVVPGQLNIDHEEHVLNTLRRAVTGCIQGNFSALVTGPVNKEAINQAGYTFSGHTEFLAALTNTPSVVMMLATTGLRVALVTTHLPLKDIFHAITPQRLEQTLRITHMALRRQFRIKQPRILVCGLNPHAGEGGHMGKEEQEIIIPVIRRLSKTGLHITGPLPADTIFIEKYLANADVIVAMYHDQGLPVLKHMGFGNAVNITLGLPFIRTSVDHGTALELAGQDTVDAGSLDAAVRMAIDMLTNHSPATH